MSTIIGIDPGPVSSAFVTLANGALVHWQIQKNDDLRIFLRSGVATADAVAIEVMQGYGMPVGGEVLTTQLWAGRFIEAYSEWGDMLQVTRTAVKGNLCRSGSGGDDNVRAALIERFGGTSVAIGGKKCRACKAAKTKMKSCVVCDGTGLESPKGALHGMTGSDVWSALAIAITAFDKQRSTT